MASALKKIALSSTCSSLPSISPHKHNNSRFITRIGRENPRKGAVFFAFSRSYSSRAMACDVGNVQRQISSLESLFCYDKPIPEEIIEKPVGLSLPEKDIGENPRCTNCQTKGAILCATCSGSGLYVDSILESQGIIVKVRCLGCGGTGNIMCSECGGRGHI
ncbi:DnaJ/Hsp40 cysteine-rich domain superfamily protein [Striga hermonthica]|uniref:DnaJ/Hsp40 cysteine-rich domain superfamily protein n=1 Tax=Striga hermonthica TaxID=68872 RepID=A0A9N7RQJ0_STRHE|nr:DnaJ/Hsp40 cysteine-rich domain superfamily protein [Striga hermonthica]